MRYAVISLTANTLGSIGLFFLFRWQGLMPHLGIAVATTLGGWLNAALLHRTLIRRGDFVARRPPQTRPARLIMVSSIAMGAASGCRGGLPSQRYVHRPGDGSSRAVALTAVVGGGLVSRVRYPG